MAKGERRPARPRARAGDRQAAAATAQENAEGGLLAINADGIVGWARDIANPTEAVRVIVLASDEPVASAIANRFDNAVVRARVGPGIPGFVVRLARLPRAAFPLRLTLRDTRGRELGPPLPVRAREHLLPAVGVAKARGDYEGFVDGLQAGTLIGWAMNRDNPAEAVPIAVHDGANLLAETVADTFRPDLLEAGKRDGRCGFMVGLPIALLDGRAHRLRVTVAGTAVELPGSPVVFGPGLAKDLLDELARLRGEVERLAGHVADLLSPNGDLQREIVRTLADRMAALAEIQRDMVERELDALRRIALDPNALLPGTGSTADAAPALARRRR